MRWKLQFGVLALGILMLAGCATVKRQLGEPISARMEMTGPRLDVLLVLDSPLLDAPLHIGPSTDGSKGSMFYETAGGMHWLRGEPVQQSTSPDGLHAAWNKTGGGQIHLDVSFVGDDYILQMSSEGGEPVTRWGFNVQAGPDEYFSGLMERVVDGPQQRSWSAGVETGLNLRGERVEMVVRPTLGIYAPFYVSSAGYGVFTYGTWPGVYDLCAEEENLVQISFDGPDLRCKIYTADSPLPVVQRHAQDTGPTIVPPKWAWEPIRWRDEHNHREEYFDGTKVDVPFNSELVEDVLMMDALGIPVGSQWVDRPFGDGPRGYSDFTWSEQRFPNHKEMIDWLHARNQRFILWIAPWVMGDARDFVVEKGWTIPKQIRNPETQPHLDFSNPETVAWWQEEGIGKFIRDGVDGFKLDRAEEWLSERGDETVHDGRTITEWRNHYPVEYVKATHDVFKKYRGDDFLLFPRAAYTGSSQYSTFWTGDIRGPQEGLRAAIIAVQRCSVMGYPITGSDTGGYHGEQREPLARWLAVSCFHPLFEVGPTWNKAPWDSPWEPSYDVELLAIWRLYSRLRMRLIDYTADCVKEAHDTGMPVVRPLFLLYPDQPEALEDWQTWQYGPDLLVSGVWRNGTTQHKLWLPKGEEWIDAWDTKKTMLGGQWVTVDAPLHKMPIFIRKGSKLQLGDLIREYEEAKLAVKTPPNLAELQKSVKLP